MWELKQFREMAKPYEVNQSEKDSNSGSSDSEVPKFVGRQRSGAEIDLDNMDPYMMPSNVLATEIHYGKSIKLGGDKGQQVVEQI